MPTDELTDVLRRGDVELKGRMPWSSNATFLVEVSLDDSSSLAVYKPQRGERMLWDFPPGLYRREVAAWVVSEALGWGIVPLTVVRADAPHGKGSLQAFVEADFEQHYFTLYEEPQHHDALRRICVFDLLVNNTDRKSGHCLLVGDQIYAIDNGLAFHEDPKLRTVIWEFATEPIPPSLLDDVRRFVESELPPELDELLSRAERDALLARGELLLDQPCFPVDHSGRRYPWPLV